MDDCTLPFALTGQVKKVLVDVSGEAVENMESKVRMHLARR